MTTDLPQLLVFDPDQVRSPSTYILLRLLEDGLVNRTWSLSQATDPEQHTMLVGLLDTAQYLAVNMARDLHPSYERVAMALHDILEGVTP